MAGRARDARAAAREAPSTPFELLAALAHDVLPDVTASLRGQWGDQIRAAGGEPRRVDEMVGRRGGEGGGGRRGGEGEGEPTASRSAADRARELVRRVDAGRAAGRTRQEADGGSAGNGTDELPPGNNFNATLSGPQSANCSYVGYLLAYDRVEYSCGGERVNPDSPIVDVLCGSNAIEAVPTTELICLCPLDRRGSRCDRGSWLVCESDVVTPQADCQAFDVAEKLNGDPQCYDVGDASGVLDVAVNFTCSFERNNTAQVEAVLEDLDELDNNSTLPADFDAILNSFVYAYESPRTDLVLSVVDDDFGDDDVLPEDEGGPLFARFDLKVWNLNRLSDERHVYTTQLTPPMLDGGAPVSWQLDLGSVDDDSFYAGGRLFVELIARIPGERDDTFIALHLDPTEREPVRREQGPAVGGSTAVLIVVLVLVGLCAAGSITAGIVRARRRRAMIKDIQARLGATDNEAGAEHHAKAD